MRFTLPCLSVIVVAVLYAALLATSMFTTLCIVLQVGSIPFQTLYYCAAGTIILAVPSAYIVIKTNGSPSFLNMLNRESGEDER